MRDAVDQTWGQVLTCGGEICDTRYYKCCGGRTELFSTCWDGPDKPYLSSIPDSFCSRATPALLSRVLNDYDLSTRDFLIWEVRYSRSELSGLVARKTGQDFGEILALDAVERGPSGRIKYLRIIGSKHTAVIGRELEIRRVLSESHLKSSAFTVEWQGDGCILRGRGWGHGVGLCQIGAARMAEEGRSCAEILSHYYPGSEISSRNE